MKKNIFLSAIILAFTTQAIVGMNQNSIIEKDDNNFSVNPIDTVNNELKDPSLDKKNSFLSDNDDQEMPVDILEDRPSKPTVIQSITNSVVNIFNSSTNKMSKITGIKDITAETEEETKKNLSGLSSIDSSDQLVSDWNNNTPLASSPSFLKKGLDRIYSNQNKAINSIYFMQKTNSYDVKELSSIENSLARSEAYQKAMSAICKQQSQMIKDRINEKLNNNDNKDSKDDKSDKEDK